MLQKFSLYISVCACVYACVRACVYVSHEQKIYINVGRNSFKNKNCQFPPVSAVGHHQKIFIS